MKSKYHIDGETADNITRIVLGERIAYIKADIKKLKRMISNHKKDHGDTGRVWRTDLADNERYLEAIEIAYEYFSGRVKTS